MKKSAYYIKDGDWFRIGIKAALAKEKKEPGAWRRRTYFSTHSSVSDCSPMHIRKSSKGNYSFVYNRKSSVVTERDGGGESLAHYLYKIAISELKQTTLKSNSLNHDLLIQIIDAQTEKRVYIDERYYDLDVYLKFESNSSYQLKWSGELAIEVHSTNPVVGQKLLDLKELRIPVIEVNISKKFAYREDEAKSTPESQRKYINFLKQRLSEYIWGTVLSDPKSCEYLEKENSNLLQRIKQQTKKNSGLIEKIEALEQELMISRTEHEKFQHLLNECRLDTKKKDESLTKKKHSISSLKKRLHQFKSMSVLQFIIYRLTNKQ